jgi:hypothetical protein
VQSLGWVSRAHINELPNYLAVTKLDREVWLGSRSPVARHADDGIGLGISNSCQRVRLPELQKANADLTKISAWMRWYFYAVATQGTMQIAIIVVMTRFRTGV